MSGPAILSLLFRNRFHMFLLQNDKEGMVCILDSCPMKDELTKIFQQLSWCPTEEVIISAQKVSEKFVIFAYCTKTDDDLDEFRFELFQRLSANELRNLPPSVAALLLHILRCAYQAGWVWGNTLTQYPPPPPESWEWRLHQEQLHIRWTSDAVHTDLEHAIGICRCRTLKCNPRNCSKSNIKCFAFCVCTRKCKNL